MTLPSNYDVGYPLPVIQIKFILLIAIKDMQVNIMCRHACPLMRCNMLEDLSLLTKLLTREQ